MNRREFIYQTGAGLGLAAAGCLAGPGLLGDVVYGGEQPSLVEASGAPGPATRAAVKGLGGMERFVAKGAKVVIKPNMSFSNPPEMATTTHPEVVKALVEMCWAAGASKVMVLDHTLRRPEDCLERTGIRAALAGMPKTLLLVLTEERFFKAIDIPNHRTLPSAMVFKDVLDADTFIAAPVAKSHSSAGVSLSMKGMMGIIYDRRSWHSKYELDSAIVDLATVIKPKLTVIDATRMLTTGGPGGPGEVIKPEKVIACTDMVAADAYTVSIGTWYGKQLAPDQIKHIKEAGERKLGRIDVDKFSVTKVKA
ncbi:MAG: DUF362 domain-containing protein [Deltaproteobacteria bacterium]|nr:DUF362 domain-containing protein [Deltaproteobacteria bacterium]